MNFISAILIFVMISLYASQNFFCKRFSLNYPGNPSNSTPVLTIVGGIVVAVVSFCFSGLRFEAQPLTIIFGIINTAALYFYNYALLKGSTSGPYSVLMIFAVIGGIVIPAAVKWVFFDEEMSLLAIGFLIMVIIAVYLMSQKPSEGNDNLNKVTPKFLMYCFLICFTNGAYAAILAVQQKITGEGDKEEVVMVTFICAAVVSLISLIAKKVNLKEAFSFGKKNSSRIDLFLYALSAALAVNILVIALLFDIQTGILLTIQNAGVMLFSVALSYIFFKEKLTRVNLIGCLLMTIGLVGISIA